MESDDKLNTQLRSKTLWKRALLNKFKPSKEQLTRIQKLKG